MKIALINNLYAQQKRGGAEIIIERLKQTLEKQGHECFIVSTAPKKIVKENKKTHYNLKKDNNTNKDYLISSLYYNLNKLPYLLRLIWHIYKQLETKSLRKVAKILKQENPDLIISHNLIGFSTEIYKLIDKLDIYHIHYLHDTQLLHPTGRIIYKREAIIDTFLARLYQKVQIRHSQYINLVISPSKWLLKLHQDKGFFENTKTWQKFNPLENINNQNIKSDSKFKFTFIYIGQIDDNKGVEIMIKSFLKISNNNKLILKIIGNGESLNVLKEKYLKYTNIVFLGRLSYQDSMRELSAANTLILPSLIYENSPTALFDALKLNKDIVATNLGGSSEIVNKYYGRLVSPNNIQSLKKAMIESLNEKDVDKKPVDLSDLQADIYIQELLKQLHFS
jgi:glycosyltransferase involved in cell wall biosynthesis